MGTYVFSPDSLPENITNQHALFWRVPMEITAYRHRVQYYETDQMKVVHHSNYIRWFEEARTDFLEKSGFSYAWMEEQGIIIPVLSVSAEYKAMVHYGELYQKPSCNIPIISQVCPKGKHVCKTHDYTVFFFFEFFRNDPGNHYSGTFRFGGI